MSALDVRSFTVGPVQENCYIVSAADTRSACDGARPAVIVDPGDEPERLLAAIDALGVRIEAILSRTATSTTSARSRRSRGRPARRCTARRSSGRCSLT